jgi:hypothetical protein
MTEKDEGFSSAFRRAAANQVQTVENLFAPELFATEASFFSSGQGNVTVTFSSYRFDNSTTPAAQKRVIVGRLVMPITGAQGLAAGLYDFLRQQNQDPMPPPGNPLQVQ